MYFLLQLGLGLIMVNVSMMLGSPRKTSLRGLAKVGRTNVAQCICFDQQNVEYVDNIYFTFLILQQRYHTTVQEIGCARPSSEVIRLIGSIRTITVGVSID